MVAGAVWCPTAERVVCCQLQPLCVVQPVAVRFPPPQSTAMRQCRRRAPRLRSLNTEMAKGRVHSPACESVAACKTLANSRSGPIEARLNSSGTPHLFRYS